MAGTAAVNARERNRKNRGQTERFPVFTALLAFHKFSKQLAYLDPGCFQCFAAQSGGVVNLGEGLGIPLLAGAEIAFLLEAVEQRIQTARADAVAVARQFLDHAEAENGLLRSVMQDVQADQTGVEIAIR